MAEGEGTYTGEWAYTNSATGQVEELPFIEAKGLVKDINNEGEATARYKFKDTDGNENNNGEGFERENDGKSILEVTKDGETLRETYEGSFHDNRRQGYGVYTYHNGDKFTGEWECSVKVSGTVDEDGTVKVQTLGKLEYAEAAAGDGGEGEGGESKASRKGQYFGNYSEVDGQSYREGPGTFTYSNGDMYCGAWKAGLKHGKGTYAYKADGTRLEGQWEGGQIASGKWIFPNGIYYIGRFKHGKPDGQGNWVFNDGVKGATQITGSYTQTRIGEEVEAGEGETPPPPVVKADWTSKEIVVA